MAFSLCEIYDPAPKSTRRNVPARRKRLRVCAIASYVEIILEISSVVTHMRISRFLREKEKKFVLAQHHVSILGTLKST